MLTIEQVEKEAITPIKALELSIRHWWENYCLTKKELERLKIDPVMARYCGLCVFYNHPYDSDEDIGSIACIKSGCKVIPTCTDEDSLYTKAADAYIEFETDPSEENYQAWRKASWRMHKYLCSLR
jgi:hypothetical protein